MLKGTWGGRPVAVKRLLSDFTRLASQEVKLLQASDDHPNVIRYYCQEKRDNFLYIALDLCQASLADLIESPEKYRELADQLDRKRALMEVTKGLKHLHGMKIIHRDIKPQSVFIHSFLVQCKSNQLIRKQKCTCIANTFWAENTRFRFWTCPTVRSRSIILCADSEQLGRKPGLAST